MEVYLWQQFNYCPVIFFFNIKEDIEPILSYSEIDFIMSQLFSHFHHSTDCPKCKKYITFIFWAID